MVTREQARLTVERLIAGYADKSGSSYGPALSNEAGCILAQKAPNRAVSNMLPCYRASADADFTIPGERLHPDRAAGLWAKDKSRQERPAKGQTAAAKCASPCGHRPQEASTFLLSIPKHAHLP